jgi:multidrug efflux pump
VIHLSSSIFQAAGKALPTLLMSVAQGAFYIPTIVVGNLWFGAWGVAFALPVSELGTAVLGLVLYLAIRKGLQVAPASVIAESDACPG